MRKTVLASAAMLAALGLSPLAAQGRGDPTMTVTSDGKLPAGWMLRFDPPRRGQPEHAPTEIKFVTMGDGFHVNSGPAAIFYRTADVGKGEFAVSATFAQSKSMTTEAYGIFIGGTNLQDSTQNYTYLVIRPSDGNFQVKQRKSNARPNPGETMSPNPAVNKDGANGAATNTLTIHVAKDTVHFIVNGKVVQALSKAQLGGTTDGIVGLRINHNEDLHISGFGIKK